MSCPSSNFSWLASAVRRNSSKPLDSASTREPSALAARAPPSGVNSSTAPIRISGNVSSTDPPMFATKNEPKNARHEQQHAKRRPTRAAWTQASARTSPSRPRPRTSVRHTLRKVVEKVVLSSDSSTSLRPAKIAVEQFALVLEHRLVGVLELHEPVVVRLDVVNAQVASHREIHHGGRDVPGIGLLVPQGAHEPRGHALRAGQTAPLRAAPCASPGCQRRPPTWARGPA